MLTLNTSIFEHTDKIYNEVSANESVLAGNFEHFDDAYMRSAEAPLISFVVGGKGCGLAGSQDSSIGSAKVVV